MAIAIIKGTAADLDDFVDLLEQVHEAMDNKEWFYLDSREEFRELMNSGRMALWLAKDGSRTVGAFDLLIPGLEDFNYGYALGFSREALMQVVNMDSAAVHPDYRGLGLQRRLLQAAEEWLSRENRILLCTIHPDNRFSLNNALKQGYTIQKQVAIYGSVRYILRKDLKKESNF